MRKSRHSSRPPLRCCASRGVTPTPTHAPHVLYPSPLTCAHSPICNPRACPLPLCAQAIHDAAHRGERAYSEDWWLAGEQRPGAVTSISMDAPTEEQFSVPVQKRTARDTVKTLDGAKKWCSKITGLLIAGLGLMAYVTRDGLGGGANLSCTLVYLGLINMVRLRRTLGLRLHLLLDNTTATNKCNEVIYFLAWLVAMDVFVEASFFCMMVGHTYCRIDQCFRTLIGQLLSYSVWTVTDLVNLIARFLRPYNCLGCVELHCLWDWAEFFKPHVHERFGGFATSQFGSGMHEVLLPPPRRPLAYWPRPLQPTRPPPRPPMQVLLRKDRDGNVRCWMRKSSQASTWLPDGDGYLVFKSIPTGIPKLERAKADHKWGKDTVLATLRAWYRYMSVSVADAALIRSDWDERFRTLPPDGDVEQLSPDMKLKWLDLPRCTQLRGGDGLGEVCGGAHDLENPEINPVTGLGRTAGDVQREVSAFREKERLLSERAVFQADFLFVQLPNSSVQLHRVAHGLCLWDSTSDDIAFTSVEYKHLPQEGFTGFWGHFTPRPNERWKPGDSKSGGKFIRHAQVARRDILVYNVSVFERRVHPSVEGEPSKRLYVSVDSLRRLASKSVSQPPIPAVLPVTHGGGTAANRPRRPRRPQGDADGGDADGGDADDADADAADDADDADADAADDDNADDDDDDPPPPIPDGWEGVAWEAGDAVSHFLLWTSIDRGRVAWHRMAVVATLPAGRRGGWTHDAQLHGQSGKRGVVLSESLYQEGCWVSIREKGGTSGVAQEEADLTPAPAPAPASEPPAAVRRKQPRRGESGRDVLPAHI